MVVTKLTQKQKKLVEDGKLVVEHNEKGEVIMPRYKCVTTHTARRSGITNMYLTHKYSIVQMMHVSGHKTQKDLYGLYQTLLGRNRRRDRRNR